MPESASPEYQMRSVMAVEDEFDKDKKTKTDTRCMMPEAETSDQDSSMFTEPQQEYLFRR